LEGCEGSVGVKGVDHIDSSYCPEETKRNRELFQAVNFVCEPNCCGKEEGED